MGEQTCGYRTSTKQRLKIILKKIGEGAFTNDRTTQYASSSTHFNEVLHITAHLSIFFIFFHCHLWHVTQPVLRDSKFQASLHDTATGYIMQAKTNCRLNQL